jgi:hypothetical protein
VLLDDDTSRLSNVCPKGISNFAGRVRCEVRGAGRTRAAPSTGIEAVAPCRASSKGDPHEIIAVLLSALAFAIGMALLGKWSDTDS